MWSEGGGEKAGRIEYMHNRQARQGGERQGKVKREGGAVCAPGCHVCLIVPEIRTGVLVCVCARIFFLPVLVPRFSIHSRLSGLHLDDLASKKETERERDGSGPTEPNKKEGIDTRVTRRWKEIIQKRLTTI